MPNEQMNNESNKVQTLTKADFLDKPMIYKIDNEEVKLTPAIVRTYIARGNAEVTDQEIVNFMNLCKYQKLNPFLNEANLIKFQGANPNAQIVVSKEFFLKRAQDNPDFDGIQAGIIVVRDGQLLDLEGAVKLKTDEIVGGWAIVHTKTRKYPSVARVSYDEYNKNQSVWKDKPLTMIRKVAEAQALREAFPKEFNGLYVEEEGATFDRSNVVQDVKNDAGKATGSTQPPKPSNEPPKPETVAKTPQNAPSGGLPDIED